jgi:hypothetical protein
LGNEESISVKLFNLPLKAAFTSYSPLRLPPPRLYHCCWTGHKPHTRRWCAWDYSQNRIAQGNLDFKLDMAESTRSCRTWRTYVLHPKWVIPETTGGISCLASRSQPEDCPFPKLFLIHMCIRWLCLHRQYLSLAISAESNELQNTAGLHNLRPNNVAAAEICTLAVEEPRLCETTA